MDLAREDLKSVGAKEGDEIDRVKWRILSRCGDPEKGEAERKRSSGGLLIDVLIVSLPSTTTAVGVVRSKSANLYS